MAKKNEKDKPDPKGGKPGNGGGGGGGRGGGGLPGVDLNSFLQALLGQLWGGPFVGGKSGTPGLGAFQQIGEFGKAPVGQVDIRTPLMRLLEIMALPQMAQGLQNPFGFAQQAINQPGVGGAPGFSPLDLTGIQPPQATGNLQGGFQDLLTSLLGAPAAPRSYANPAGNVLNFGPTGSPPVGASPTGSPPMAPGPQNAPPGQPGPSTGGNKPALPETFASGPSWVSPGTISPEGKPVVPSGYARQLLGLSEGHGPLSKEPQYTGALPLVQFDMPGAAKGAGNYINFDDALGWIVKMLEGAPPDYTGAAGLLGQFPKSLIQSGSMGGVQIRQQPEQKVGTLFSLPQLAELLNVKFLQGGGYLDPNQLNIVGEQGPEVVAGNTVLPLQTQGTPVAGNPALLQGNWTMNSSLGGGGLPGGNLPLNPVIPGQQSGGGSGGGGGGGGAGGAFNFQMPSLPNLPQLPGAPNLPQVGGFQPSALQGAGTGATQRLLEANPEQQALQFAMNPLSKLLGTAPGSGIMQALSPIFQRNLQFGLGELRNLAPSVANQQTAIAGTDLTRQALQDFNLMAAQAAQQGQQTQLGGMSVLAQLAGQAGQNPFARALGAGQLGLGEAQAQTGAGQTAAAQNAANMLQQFGLQQQGALGMGGLGLQGFGLEQQGALGMGGLGLQGLTNLRQQDIGRELGLSQLAQQQNQFMNQFELARQQQAYNQYAQPSLQLLMALLGMAQPTAFQTIVGPKKE